MKKTWMLLSVSAVFTVAGMAASLSGTISDANCGAKHAAATAGDAACVQKCVKGGAPAVLVSDGKVYKIAADSQGKVASLLGQKVTVDGKISGDTVDIASVSAAK